jgi:hypothetical protein
VWCDAGGADRRPRSRKKRKPNKIETQNQMKIFTKIASVIGIAVSLCLTALSADTWTPKATANTTFLQVQITNGPTEINIGVASNMPTAAKIELLQNTTGIDIIVGQKSFSNSANSVIHIFQPSYDGIIGCTNNSIYVYSVPASNYSLFRTNVAVSHLGNAQYLLYLGATNAGTNKVYVGHFVTNTVARTTNTSYWLWYAQWRK